MRRILPVCARARAGACVRHASTSGKMQLYGFDLSQPTRSIMLLCSAENIPFDFHVVSALKGDNKKPEYIAVNPAGQVPCIVDDNIGVLAESAAILTYLCEKNQLKKWFPDDINTRAHINFWMHWHHSHTRLCTMKILVNSMYAPRNATFEEAMGKARKSLANSFKFLNSQLEKGVGRTFLAGTAHPTIADLLLLPEMDQLDEPAFDLMDYSPYPHLKAWMRRCQATLPGYYANYGAVIKHGELYKCKQNAEKKRESF